MVAIWQPNEPDADIMLFVFKSHKYLNSCLILTIDAIDLSSICHMV